MSEVNEPILWAGLIYIEDKKLLTLRESDKDFNLVPGGKLEPGESDEDALLREVREELGVTATSFTFYRDIVEPSRVTGETVRFRLFTGDVDRLPDVNALPGKTVAVDFIDSNHEAEGIRLGALLQALLPVLAADGLIA